MKYPIDYDKTLKIEVLNEYAKGVYAKLLNYMYKNNIDTKDSNYYAILINHFREILRMNLFNISDKELDDIDKYWGLMDKYVELITKADLEQKEIKL